MIKLKKKLSKCEWWKNSKTEKKETDSEQACTQ